MISDNFDEVPTGINGVTTGGTEGHVPSPPAEVCSPRVTPIQNDLSALTPSCSVVERLRRLYYSKQEVVGSNPARILCGYFPQTLGKH